MTEKEILTGKTITRTNEIATLHARREDGPKTFADISYDAGFKAVFCDRANKPVLINFLNAFLPPERQIADLDYLGREIDTAFLAGRGARLDLHCRSTRGEEFIVEMQRRPFAHFFRRCMAYVGRVYSDQVPRGTKPDYDKVLPVHLIAVLNSRMDEPAFSKADDGGRLRLDYAMTEKETQVIAEDTFICTFVLLYNLGKQRIEDCTTSQEKYMYHFKTMWRQTEETADTEGNDEFAQLQRAAHVATFSREKMDQYVRDMNLDFEIELERDYAIKKAAEAGEAKGMAEGLAEGEAKGRLEGLTEGEAKGKTEGKLETDKAMLLDGISPEKIKLYTGLSSEEILAIS